MGSFTLGKADILRQAMSKKKKVVIDAESNESLSKVHWL